jgi:hypothetical protein
MPGKASITVGTETCPRVLPMPAKALLNMATKIWFARRSLKLGRARSGTGRRSAFPVLPPADFFCSQLKPATSIGFATVSVRHMNLYEK